MPNWTYPEFDWDDGNIDHLIDRHGIDPEIVEQVFYNGAFVVRAGDRYRVYGQDNEGQHLFIVCTLRGNAVRVISARPMTDKERHYYERHH